MQPIIILVQPQLPENLGAVARGMANFCLTQLRLVSPIAKIDDPRAIAMSAGAEKILEEAQIYSTLAESIADLHKVYGTTACERQMVKRYNSAKQAAVLVHKDLSENLQVGIVFGPERTGLNNDDLVLCNDLVQIPVNPEFSSLNLGQAVSVIAYECYQEQLGKTIKPFLHIGESELASKGETQSFLNELEKELDSLSFWRIAHKKPIMWRNLQNIFTRSDFTKQEIRTLRGLVKTFRPSSKT